MAEVTQIAVLLLELYLTLGIMAIGFGMMMGGKAWAQQVGRFFFVRPFALMGAAARYRARQLLAFVWHVIVGLLLLPIARLLWRALRWPLGNRRRIALALGLILLCALTFVALAAAAPVSAQSVSLKAQRHNMFRVDVVLNEHVSAHALIDTGASYLSLCAATGARLRLKLGDAIYLNTYTGTILARRAIVASLRIGAIELRNVVAAVKSDPACNEGDLVGMSVLRKLHMTMTDDTLTLTAGPAVGWWQHWPWLAAVWTILMLSVIGRSRQRSRMLARLERVQRYRTGATFSRS